MKETSTSLNDCCVYNFTNIHIEGFGPIEVEKVNILRKLYHDLNAPLMPSFKIWIRQNMENTIPVSFFSPYLFVCLLHKLMNFFLFPFLSHFQEVLDYLSSFCFPVSTS